MNKSDSKQEDLRVDPFEPSLAAHAPAAHPRRRPWRLGSQFYVAFFGGTFAVTAIAFLNAKRLGLDAARRRFILVFGIACGLLTKVAVFHVIADPALVTEFLGQDIEPKTVVRIGSRLIAILVFAVFYKIQKQADRLYQVGSVDGEEPYASLWKPGLIAVFLFIVIELAIAVFLVALATKSL
jgi:hypothetical protein